MIRRAVLATAISIFAASSACAEPPADVASSIESRAIKAGFDGAILVGEADGSRRVLTLGAKPVDPRATWRWASITKQLAAVIAFQEVAAGRLDLNAPVQTYWPDWKAPNTSTIRIRDLLNHNSGLPQPDESKPDADGVPAFYRAQAAAPAESASGFCAGRPKAEPPAK